WAQVGIHSVGKLIPSWLELKRLKREIVLYDGDASALKTRPASLKRKREDAFVEEDGGVSNQGEKQDGVNDPQRKFKKIQLSKKALSMNHNKWLEKIIFSSKILDLIEIVEDRTVEVVSVEGLVLAFAAMQVGDGTTIETQLVISDCESLSPTTSCTKEKPRPEKEIQREGDKSRLRVKKTRGVRSRRKKSEDYLWMKFIYGSKSDSADVGRSSLPKKISKRRWHGYAKASHEAFCPTKLTFPVRRSVDIVNARSEQDV
ncbi:hypothetical protein QAD02_013194, partial [Eretmocerus hayati]